MNKNKALIISIICIAVAIAGVITALIVTDKFKGDEETTLPSTTQPATTQQIVQGRPKNEMPESVVAAEYSVLDESAAEDLANFEKLGFNTVIFELTDLNAENVAALLETAAESKLYLGIKADISEESAFVTDFTTKNNTDFVILSGCDESVSDYDEKVGTVCNKIKESDPAMIIGLEPVLCSKVSEHLTSLIDEKAADFVYLRHESKNNSAFKTAQTVWNEEACSLWLCHSLDGLSQYTTQNAEDMIELISVSAEMSMCRALSFAPYSEIANAKGTCAEIVMNYIRERDTYLLDKEFSLTSHSKTSITVEQSTITFRGTSSPAHELKCNGKVLEVAKNGDFSTDVSLSVGENTVKFEHKGKTYTYKVTYKIKLLKSVSPSEDISVPGEMLVEVSAVAHKNANVSVSFNGKTYKMTATGAESDTDDAKPDESSDFTTFTASLQTPESKATVQNLGKYKVTATYKSLSESMNGATIKVTEKIVVTPPPTTTTTTTTTTTEVTTSSTSAGSTGESVSDNTDSSQPAETTSEAPSASNGNTNTLQKYYYTENYGLGTAKICEIIDDYVEVYPGNTTSTFSVPDCSPLLKGTVDYVTSTATYDGDRYYILASGVKVPELREERLSSGVDGKITHVKIKDGYVMPKNSIRVVSSKTSGVDTVIELEMNRPVAFNAKITGQTYSNYNGTRPVVVSSLNCKGFEITFSDTETAQGTVSLSDSVCRSAKWSSGNNSTVTLTFELSQAGKFYGFHYEYNDNGNLVITINGKPSSLSGYKILLDPGHGGLDGGAPCSVSSTGFGNEKDINISIANKVKELLEAEGATVVMTRTSDKWVCYADRNAAVRNYNPDMFISIHCDSSTSASAMGTSAYYYRAYSQPLAKAIHARLVDAYKNEIYKDESQTVLNKVSRGANFYAFRVARVEECPAILIEYGFVSNIQECQVLQTPANRDILAYATVQGIKDYISAS